MRVYLAGGMKSGWQEVVKSAVPDHVYIDPSTHNLVEPDQYTMWDLAGVNRCDWVFAYMEESNPSGIGMAVEIGYAKALNKPIIFVDGKKEDHRLGMVRSCASMIVQDLDTGIMFLQSCQQNWCYL